ncbi:hypothetical protein GQF04_27315 [Paenibacillus aceris]|nr:hypothetical protein [Paenibacillus aceris]
MLIRTIDQFTNNTGVSSTEIGFTDDVFGFLNLGQKIIVKRGTRIRRNLSVAFEAFEDDPQPAFKLTRSNQRLFELRNNATYIVQYDTKKNIFRIGRRINNTSSTHRTKILARVKPSQEINMDLYRRNLVANVVLMRSLLNRIVANPRFACALTRFLKLGKQERLLDLLENTLGPFSFSDNNLFRLEAGTPGNFSACVGAAFLTNFCNAFYLVKGLSALRPSHVRALAKTLIPLYRRIAQDSNYAKTLTSAIFSKNVVKVRSLIRQTINSPFLTVTLPPNDRVAPDTPQST